MRGIAIIGIDGVAGGAARRAIVAGLIVRAEKPQVRIVQPRLRQVDHRHRDAAAGPRPAIRLTDVGTPRLVQRLQCAADVRQTDFGELAADDSAAALEHAKHVGRRNRLPGRQRHQARENAHVGHGRVDGCRVADRRRLAIGRVRLAEDIALERQDAVVVRSPAPEHRAGRHQAALAGLDDLQVAGAASESRHAIVARVDEAHVLGPLTVEQRVAALRVAAAAPARGIRGQHVRLVHDGVVACIPRSACCSGPRSTDHRVAAVAIGAAEHHARIDVHGRVIGRDVTADAAVGLRVGLRGGLARGRGRCTRVRARHRLLLFARDAATDDACDQHHRHARDAEQGATGGRVHDAERAPVHVERFQ